MADSCALTESFWSLARIGISSMGDLPFLRSRLKILGVPLDRSLQGFHDSNGGAIAEQPLGLGGVGARKRQVALARGSMNSSPRRRVREFFANGFPDHLEELEERGLVAERHVVSLAERRRILHRGGEQVRLHHVVD